MNNNKSNVITLGCRLNIYESEVIKSIIKRNNINDYTIINSCAVTNDAEKKVDYEIRKAKRLDPSKKIILTGRKINKKKYWHTGYPGGIKSKTYKEILNSKNSTLDLKDAVRRMLKDGPLSRKQLKNLYIYSNDKHPHSANNPLVLNFNN